MAVDVFDSEGKPLRGGVGELVCTKPWPGMTRGIWGDPDRYMATYWSRWPNVWVHGDWASIDADGDWFLHGRSDDTLNVAGKRLGPAEVESILAEHGAVAESAAVGVPDLLKGEVIVCFAVLRSGHTACLALKDELRQRVALALGKSFAPEDVRFVSELPKTRSGKIVRRVIRKVAIGEDPGDLSSIENLARSRPSSRRFDRSRSMIVGEVAKEPRRVIGALDHVDFRRPCRGRGGRGNSYRGSASCSG